MGSPAHALELVDDRGVTVVVPASPKRVVSLLPSLTETVCALGACERLVGVDTYSNQPASVKKLPHVGGGMDPNIEAIVALRPDLVLLAASTPALARLESLGLKVVALEPKTHADVQRTLQTLGQIWGPANAIALWLLIDATFNQTAAGLPVTARGLRVYVEVNSAHYAASESSFIGETLTRLGARNIVPASMGPFPKLNPEFIVRADPDVIMVVDRDQGDMARRPGWAQMRVVRAGRVCTFTSTESDALVRPGPRMAEGAQILARCLQTASRHTRSSGETP
jgi:iron complex transport system substrate-binding protein